MTDNKKIMNKAELDTVAGGKMRNIIDRPSEDNKVDNNYNEHLKRLTETVKDSINPLYNSEPNPIERLMNDKLKA